MALCSPWIDSNDVAECCDIGDCDSPSILQGAAEVASDLLFRWSARQFPGLCERTVRPCRTTCGCPWQVLSRGYVVWNWNWWWTGGWYGSWNCSGDSCGCRPYSRVLLGGYVQEITEVLINGDVLDPALYRVDDRKWLVRVRETPDDEIVGWPGCQNMDLPETEDGTWAVTYTYGRDVPMSGVNAATELACQIFKQCTNQKCSLPSNVTRNARQGVIAEKPAFFAWAFKKGVGWQTGLPAVDQFLSAVNPTGVPRMPVVWSPSTPLRYAPSVGLPSTGT